MASLEMKTETTSKAALASAKTTAVKAALLPGRVGHVRTGPKKHEFHYSIGLFQIDISQLPALSKQAALFKYNRSWIGYSFKDSDYFQFAGDEFQDLTLVDKVRKYFVDQGAEVPSQIIYIGNIRYMNHIFNPVCFFYGLKEDGSLIGVLSQVTNTYHEQKAYYVPASANGTVAEKVEQKLFYVSPFIAPDTSFRFKLPAPSETMRIQIDALDTNGNTVLYAWFSGKLKKFSRSRLAWWYFRYPFQSFIVLVHIHYQALRLYLKKLQVFGKRESDEETRKIKQGYQSATG